MMYFSRIDDLVLHGPFRQVIVLLLLALGFAAGGAGYATAATCGQGNHSEEMRGAVALYHQGWEGSDAALVEAIARLEQLQKVEPLAAAYLGSARVAQARLVPDEQKRGLLTRGARALHVAVRREPEDVEIRFLRARSLAVLPRMAGQVSTLEEDLTWLVAAAERRNLAPDCAASIYLLAGSHSLRNRDPAAFGHLRGAVALAADEALRESAARLLRSAEAVLPPTASP